MEKCPKHAKPDQDPAKICWKNAQSMQNLIRILQKYAGKNSEKKIVNMLKMYMEK